MRDQAAANRPGLGHQRTSSSGRLTTTARSSRDGSPAKPPPINVHTPPGSPRARPDSPTKRAPAHSAVGRTLTRRSSLRSDAASPTVTKQKSFDSPPQEYHVPRALAGPSSHTPSPNPTTTPLHPSSLRRVSTPPVTISPEPEPEPEQPTVSPAPIPSTPEPEPAVNSCFIKSIRNYELNNLHTHSAATASR